jgi:hypothetical protein
MRGFFFWSVRMAKLSPVFNWAELINGIPATGAKVFTYVAGSSTKQNTYTDEGGLTANPNPIILDARGEPPNDIWLSEGQSYKFVFTASTDTDPPTSPIRTIDDITGVNDTGTTTSQWVDSGVTPTYVNATQFTLPGDQTTEFQVNRRIKATVTAGTVYGYISASIFGALTTVTVVLDSGTLDSGLSSVQLGLITPNNSSLLVTASLLKDSIFNDLTTSTLELDDYLPFAETDDSGNKKKALVSAIRDLFAPRGYIDGLIMSTAGSSATMAIAAGEAKDSTNAAVMQLAASISKTTSAWAVGTAQGGLDTGSIANDTWYHFYLIRRPDTGVVDVVFSTSASAPTLPANYTQYRRIGAGRTNGSAQWTRFFQNGDEFLWETPALDFNATNPGTSAVSRTLRVPTGIVVYAISNWMVLNTASGVNFSGVISSLDTTDSAPNISAAPLINLGGNVATASGNVAYASAYLTIKTNTSGQVRSRMLGSDANCNLRASTVGWIDTRGRDA